MQRMIISFLLVFLAVSTTACTAIPDSNQTSQTTLMTTSGNQVNSSDITYVESTSGEIVSTISDIPSPDPDTQIEGSCVASFVDEQGNLLPTLFLEPDDQDHLTIYLHYQASFTRPQKVTLVILVDDQSVPFTVQSTPDYQQVFITEMAQGEYDYNFELDLSQIDLSYNHKLSVADIYYPISPASTGSQGNVWQMGKTMKFIGNEQNNAYTDYIQNVPVADMLSQADLTKQYEQYNPDGGLAVDLSIPETIRLYNLAVGSFVQILPDDSESTPNDITGTPGETIHLRYHYYPAYNKQYPEETKIALFFLYNNQVIKTNEQSSHIYAVRQNACVEIDFDLSLPLEKGLYTIVAIPNEISPDILFFNQSFSYIRVQ